MSFPDDVSALRRNDSVESQQIRKASRRVERAHLNALEHSRFEGARRRIQSWVLEEMNWISDGGFELIPADGAHAYLQEKEYAFVGNGEKIDLDIDLDDVEPSGHGQPWVVVLQSSNYDIVVLPYAIPDAIPSPGWVYPGYLGNIVADLYIFDRAFRMPRIAQMLGRFTDHLGLTLHQFQFVEVDGERPQELMRISIDERLGWSDHYSILSFEAGHLRHLYDYKRSAPPTGIRLEHRRVTEPDLLEVHPIPFDESDVGDNNRLRSFSFRETAVVELGLRDSAYPEAFREAPIERHECRGSIHL